MAKLPKYICFKVRIKDGLTVCIDPVEPEEVAADVRPVVYGHWVWNPNGIDWGLGAWCCDQCRTKAETWWANDHRRNPLHCSGGHYCGNCGAVMRKEDTT